MEETVKLHTWRRDRLKEHEISKKTIAELCGRLFIEDEIIKANQLGIIKKEIENPSFNYNCPNSAWELYQHCTYAIRETTPLFWHKSHQRLGDFFNDEFVLGKPVEQILELV